MFKDIDIFLSAAQAILRGVDPYSIPNLEVFYPLPFYLLFAPWVSLPREFVHGVWMALQAVIFIAILRRRALPLVFSAPVLLTLLLGQVDILMMGLFALLRTKRGGGIALAFMALKPQLVLLLAPWMLWYWWRHDRRQMAVFFLILGMLVIGSFIIQPDWLVRLLGRSGERMRMGISSSVWGLFSFLPTPLWLVTAGLIALTTIIWAWREDHVDIVAASGLFVSPFIFSYNLTPLLVVIRQPLALWGLSVLSWICFAISAWQSNDRASVSIVIMIVALLVWQKQNAAIFSKPR